MAGVCDVIGRILIQEVPQVMLRTSTDVTSAAKLQKAILMATTAAPGAQPCSRASRASGCSMTLARTPAPEGRSARSRCPTQHLSSLLSASLFRSHSHSLEPSGRQPDGHCSSISSNSLIPVVCQSQSLLKGTCKTATWASP